MILRLLVVICTSDNNCHSVRPSLRVECNDAAINMYVSSPILATA